MDLKKKKRERREYGIYAWVQRSRKCYGRGDEIPKGDVEEEERGRNCRLL